MRCSLYILCHIDHKMLESRIHSVTRKIINDAILRLYFIMDDIFNKRYLTVKHPGKSKYIK